MSVVRALFAFFSSHKLAVVLLVLIGILTWLGTLAQIDKGLHIVQKEYFESWFVWCKLPMSIWGQPLLPRDDGGLRYLTIPMPGAYPLMLLLFINIVVGGMARMKVGWRNIGVLVAHLGMALLLVAGFVKLHYSDSGLLVLVEAPQDGAAVGDRQFRSAIYTSYHNFELALLHDRGDQIEERVIPEATLSRASDGEVVKLPVAGLPFSIEVHHWADNIEVMPKGPMVQAKAPVIDGAFLAPLNLDPKHERNVAGCYVTVVTDAGERLEGMLTGEMHRPRTKYRMPFTFTVDGERYGLDLRRVTLQLPFEVQLDEIQTTYHPGTMSAADYRSFVTVYDGSGDDVQEQKYQVFMNQPLRRDGFILFQSTASENTSGFEVARNPSDQWPNYACWVMFIGLLIHFSLKLYRFLNSSTREALSS